MSLLHTGPKGLFSKKGVPPVEYRVDLNYEMI